MSEIHNFRLVEKQHSDDLESDLYEFEHIKTGARVAVIENDDSNKVFYIGFRTPSQNSTGVAHILEHSTLTGSRKYPVKEPFVELAKGSLNTFLNAMTYADRTVYPIASTNDKDFRNLMDVYLDAVFYPKIYESPYTFMQEGWHYHLENPEDDLTYNGVVYNEMKGVYSDPESYVEKLIDETLFPDTIYSKDSGGEPGIIPQLTYEDFLDFHKKFYHPSNSYIYLYGNIDLDEQLAYLDSWLSDYEREEINSSIPIQEPVESEVSGVYPIIPGEEKKNKDYLTLSYVLWPDMSSTESLILTILTDFLLGDNAAVLKKALVEAGLAGEVEASINPTIKQPIITIQLKETDINKSKDEFIKIVDSVLNDVANGNFDQEKLQAVINNNEFKILELLSRDNSGFPTGLLLGLNLLQGWIYDKKPFERLDFSEQFKNLRDQVENGEFQEFVRRVFLENPHKALVGLTPDENLLGEQERALRQELESYKEQLSEDELNHLVEETQKLIKIQSSPDSEEGLATIPHLRVADIDRNIQSIDWTEEKIDGVPVLYVEGGSQDIVYLIIEFNTNTLKTGDLDAYSIFTEILGTLETEQYDYQELNKAFQMYSGGFSTSTHITEDRKTSELTSNFRFQIKFRVKNLSKILELLEQVFLKTSFEDKKLIENLIKQLRLENRGEILARANNSAALRLRAYTSKASRLAEKIGGIENYEYLTKIDENFEENWESLKKAFEHILATLVNINGLTIGFACKEKYKDEVEEGLKSFIEKIPAEKLEKQILELEALTPREAFITAGNVNYNAKGSRVDKELTKDRGVLQVLQTILSMDYLWNKIRVLGGAYGTGFRTTANGDVFMSSFRDPHLSKTLDNFDGIVDYVSNLNLTDSELEKYIIGAISPHEVPIPVKDKIRRALDMYFSNYTNEERQAERIQILETTENDLKKQSQMLKEVMDDNLYVTIGTEREIKDHEDMFSDIHILN